MLPLITRVACYYNKETYETNYGLVFYYMYPYAKLLPNQ